MIPSRPRRDAEPLLCRTETTSLDAPVAPLRRIDSQTLLGSAEQIEIKHRGAIYRLRRTTLGKLILTK
jgi:hemin uptake protein HemP